MLTTAQFRVFTAAPDDRPLVRARHMLREGRLEDAESAYLDVLRAHPWLRPAWGEYFQFLRAECRYDEALALAARARRHFGSEPFADALHGAALVELGRFREGLEALERAAEGDPHLALVWHEAGYAAYRLGEHSRALAALDRAFALEPHSSTLHLRGRILQEAGRFFAAEVAFQGAAESAESEVQRVEADRQIERTRRFQAVGDSPTQLRPHHRWFAETGGVILSGIGAGVPATDADVLRALVSLVRDARWALARVISTDGWHGADHLAGTLGLPLHPPDTLAAGGPALVVGRRLTPEWAGVREGASVAGQGVTFLLEQGPSGPAADLAGRLEGATGPVDPEARRLVAEPSARLARLAAGPVFQPSEPSGHPIGA